MLIILFDSWNSSQTVNAAFYMNILKKDNVCWLQLNLWKKRCWILIYYNVLANCAFCMCFCFWDTVYWLDLLYATFFVLKIQIGIVSAVLGRYNN